jgi:alkylation response protein AidB-like acyl-CoA dehydrogenase
MSFTDELSTVIEQVVAPQAAETDRSGQFPDKSIRALADIGVLGLTVPAAHGGGGAGLDEAAAVIRSLAAACGSTAMIVLMHYSAVAALTAGEQAEVLAQIAGGSHLSTLAFSEAGSRSHFWVPLSSAVPSGDGLVALTARKSWVTAAAHADSYVWSSRPLAADGPMTLWLVPAGTAGVTVTGPFDGLGLRGNGSVPVTAQDAQVPATAMIGADGGGLDLALTAVLPWFLILNASASVGLMEAVTAETTAHLTRTRLEHLDIALADQPAARAALARMRIAADSARALVADTVAAAGAGRPDAMLGVLEVKAAAGDSAAAVTDLAMKTCGGAAFRRELGIERRFRDSLAARVMAPTSDALLDFVGRVLTDRPLLDPAAS